MRGGTANLVIRQGEPEAYQPVLYIEPLTTTDQAAFAPTLKRALPQVQAKYPGIGLKPTNHGWEVTVPASYHVGHEAHFSQVTEQFLDYVARGALPDWEVPNMLAKYYTTTAALDLARRYRKRLRFVAERQLAHLLVAHRSSPRWWTCAFRPGQPRGQTRCDQPRDLPGIR